MHTGEVPELIPRVAALADQHVAAAASAAELAPLPLSVYHAAMAGATTLPSRGEWTGVADELGSLRERVPAGVAELVATRIGPLQCEALVEPERPDEAAALLAPRAGARIGCGRGDRRRAVAPARKAGAAARQPGRSPAGIRGRPGRRRASGSASRPSPGWWPRASPTARSARSCSCRPRRSNITSAISSPRSGCAPVTSWRRAWLGVSDPRPAAPPGRGRERCASGD